MKFNLDKKREELLRQPELRVLNTAFSYTTEDGFGGVKDIRLFTTPQMEPSIELCLHAMERLAQEILEREEKEKNFKIDNIKIFSPVVNTMEDFFLENGFTILLVGASPLKDKHFIKILRMIKPSSVAESELNSGVATINKDEFLKRFTGKSTIK